MSSKFCLYTLKQKKKKKHERACQTAKNLMYHTTWRGETRDNRCRRHCASALEADHSTSPNAATALVLCRHCTSPALLRTWTELVQNFLAKSSRPTVDTKTWWIMRSRRYLRLAHARPNSGPPQSLPSSQRGSRDCSYHIVAMFLAARAMLPDGTEVSVFAHV